jgi:hypothetical protein
MLLLLLVIKEVFMFEGVTEFFPSSHRKRAAIFIVISFAVKEFGYKERAFVWKESANSFSNSGGDK